MPYRPHIVALLETGLSECFKYHDALDDFVRRAGLTAPRMSSARERAEGRNKQSQRGFSRAPKRLVVQELLRDLDTCKADDDRLVAALITALCKGEFPDATPDGQAAINRLKEERVGEARESAERRAEQRRNTREAELKEERAAAAKRAKREEFSRSFLELSQIVDPQMRGFRLEKFLNDFLDYEGLNPRGSFKLMGEQIDGSFAWNGRTYLVEAKWVKMPVGGAGFGGLMYKIEGKSADTRGLFISINGYSQDALRGLQTKGELRFACIDGTHLMRSLEYGYSFPKLLEIIWRHAGETGEAYLPASSPAFLAAVSRPPPPQPSPHGAPESAPSGR